jgi:Mlc titration factor MtfA (ptsG expression regulator)
VTAAFVAAIVAVALAVLTGLLLPPWLRRLRRKRDRERPLSASWRAILVRNVPVTREIPADHVLRFEGLVQSFLREKQFVGCGGLVITDEVRVTVAAQACMLLLGRPASLYDELQSILVYPGAFWVEDEVHDDDGLVTRRRRELAGEAWDSHRIILSWDDVTESLARPGDGYNVVVHEFAHYLEAEGRGLAPAAASGDAPRADPRGRARTWNANMAREFAAFCERVGRGEDTFLDPYAAEDESEFLAVATEDFVECGAGLRDAEPRLYALLTEYYGIDPARWSDEARKRAGVA